jgi:hypothetical protein
VSIFPWEIFVVVSPVLDQWDHCFDSVLSVSIGEIRGFFRTVVLKPPTAGLKPPTKDDEVNLPGEKQIAN